MEIGIGLPSTTPGSDGKNVVEWAKQAESGPFASVGVLDRIAYDAWEPLTALAAAAAVTQRLALVTMVLIAPLRPAALLAQQAATVDTLSGGRLVLGISVGARRADYRAAGVDPSTRGAVLDRQVVALRDIWEGGSAGPSPHRPGGPPILIGGSSPGSLARIARSADGYVHGGGPPRSFASAAGRVRAAWDDAARPGDPQLFAQAYFGLVDPQAGDAYLRDYYAFTGAFAEKIAAGNLTSASEVREYVRGYEEAGCDHLVLLPTTSDPREIEALAEVVGA